jgi:hypothetical protein
MAAMTEDDILNDDLDFILSQMAEEMENEYKCEQDLNNLTISQCITSYFDADDLNDLTLFKISSSVIAAILRFDVNHVFY